MKRLTIVLTLLLLSLSLTACKGNVQSPKIMNAMTHVRTSEIDRVLKDQKFNGTIYIQHKGKVIKDTSIGVKNIAGRKLKSNDLFLIGSCQKFLTGIVVKKLEDKKLIDRNRLVSYYLPEFKGLSVTVKELLMHRSGLGTIKPNKKYIGLNQTIRNIAAQGINPVQKHRYAYNDANYIVLAKIIEVVSHKSYQDNISEYIFQPMKLHHAAFYNNTAYQKKFVSGMAKKDGKNVDIIPKGLDQYDGTGNIYMSAKDIAIITHAFANYKFFSPAETHKLTTNIDDNIQAYRYGFKVQNGHYRIRGLFFGQEVVCWFNKDTSVVLATNEFDYDDAKKNEKMVSKIFQLIKQHQY